MPTTVAGWCHQGGYATDLRRLLCVVAEGEHVVAWWQGGRHVHQVDDAEHEVAGLASPVVLGVGVAEAVQVEPRVSLGQARPATRRLELGSLLVCLVLPEATYVAAMRAWDGPPCVGEGALVAAAPLSWIDGQVAKPRTAAWRQITAHSAIAPHKF